LPSHDAFRRYPLEGPHRALADRIAATTGRPGELSDRAELLAAIRAAFPTLPAPDSLEECSTHPALTLKLRSPGFGREGVKVVLVPVPGALEARVRLELPGGSYRKETLERLLRFMEEVEAALAGPRAGGP